MDYIKIYNNIIDNAKSENRIKLNNADSNYVYYEKHHIVPRCAGGDNSVNNLVLLTGKEHYICHWLLTKFPYSSSIKESLIYAFFAMSNKKSNGQDRYVSAIGYENARKMFSKFHPCKKSEIKLKISDTLKSKPKKQKIILTEERICRCGCNNIFIVKNNSIRYYFNKTHAPGWNKSAGKKISNKITNYISSLSESEKIERMKKSAFSCDHIQRGKKISEGKKGKKTNQINISMIKYGNMTEEEFQYHILNRNQSQKTKMINLRKKYFDTRN